MSRASVGCESLWYLSYVRCLMSSLLRLSRLSLFCDCDEESLTSASNEVDEGHGDVSGDAVSMVLSSNPALVHIQYVPIHLVGQVTRCMGAFDSLWKGARLADCFAQERIGNSVQLLHDLLRGQVSGAEESQCSREASQATGQVRCWPGVKYVRKGCSAIIAEAERSPQPEDCFPDASHALAVSLYEVPGSSHALPRRCLGFRPLRKGGHLDDELLKERFHPHEGSIDGYVKPKPRSTRISRAAKANFEAEVVGAALRC
jgi:hypothetical protein